MTTGLVLIDVQNAILRGLARPDRVDATAAALDQVVARLALVKQRAREADVPIFLIQHEGPSDYRLATGTDGWQLRPEIATSGDDTVVHKRSCDSFHETDLHAQLQAHGVDRIVVGGLMSPFCVDTACRRAVSMGYDVTLLSDGHMTSDMGGLSFAQIITHHNTVLDGFDAGDKRVGLATSESIAFRNR